MSPSREHVRISLLPPARAHCRGFRTRR